ncbi:MAG: carotenoid biosynthesis protein [Candidatus Hydrogenedentes bacterium]|nr:carotenoid biosynthesis protein [Candidatus Hydrogenedentota bacterium]
MRIRLLAVGLIGTLAELAGVHTGFPFGGYQYTDALSPLVAGVPIVMACAWMVLAGFVHQIVATLQLPRTVSIFLFASLLTAIDLIIDPLAAGPLEYWTWDATGAYYGIPVTNFAGWFLVSLAAAVAMGHDYQRTNVHWFVGYSITLFFTILAAVNGMGFVTFIGAVLLALVAYVFSKHGARRVSVTETARLTAQ